MLSVIAAGVKIADSQRFGLHNLRHSLATWLISKAKEDPKTVQGSLRHSKIQTTLDLYAQEDMDEMWRLRASTSTPSASEPGVSSEAVGAIVGATSGTKVPQVRWNDGGDDGTRTRGLCRDRAAF